MAAEMDRLRAAGAEKARVSVRSRALSLQQTSRVPRTAAPRVVLGAALWVALLVLPACGSSSTVSATTLLARAASTFSQVTSFHFVLTAQHLGATDPLPVTQATGDVRRPDMLSTTATVNSAFGAVQVKLIIIGQQEWITNPLTGTFEPTSDYAGLLAIFDAQQGVGAALARLQYPSTPQSASAAAGNCWKISGTLPASAIAAVVNGAATSSQSVPTTVCIGMADDELYSVSLAGPVSQTDTSQTMRTFTLTQFNQTVTITPPALTPTAS
jgi:lipoprotein LprG